METFVSNILLIKYIYKFKILCLLRSNVFVYQQHLSLIATVLLLPATPAVIQMFSFYCYNYLYYCKISMIVSLLCLLKIEFISLSIKRIAASVSMLNFEQDYHTVMLTSFHSNYEPITLLILKMFLH